MHMIRVIAVIGSLCAAGAAFAADTVTIKAYAPEVGVEHSYRLQKATETDLSFWRGAGAPITIRGDFRQRMTVLAKDTQSLRMRWSLSAEQPDTGVATYELNRLQRAMLAAFGVRQLDVTADLGGAPTDVILTDQQRDDIKRAAQAAAGRSDSLSVIIARTNKDPYTLINILTPEAAILAAGQSDEDDERHVGEQWEQERTENIDGVDVAVSARWKLETVDAQAGTAILSAFEVFDPATFSQSQKALIDRTIAGLTRAKPLDDDRLAQANRASRRRAIQVVVSLADGATIEAVETITSQVAGAKMTAYSHLQREDKPAILEKPAILKIDPPPGSIAPVSFEVAKAQIVFSPISLEQSLEIALKPESMARFKDFTTAALGKRAQLVADGQMITELRIDGTIADGRLIISGHAQSELQAMVDRLTVPGVALFIRVAP